MRREQFIPDRIWVLDDETGWYVPLHRRDNPQRWQELCASNEPIITQVDDGATDRGIDGTSSSSAPSLMREMIDLLNVAHGMSVLEIGAGTGYNAALLTEITGPGKVTTVDVDPQIAAHARQALARAEYPVTVVAGDGTAGYPANAPYDRVIATAAVQAVPYAWVEQTRPGGHILLPWASAADGGGVLLMLSVHDDGSAHGRFGRHVAFMRLRQQRVAEDVPWWEDEDDGKYIQTTTRVDPRELFEIDVRFVLGACLPGVSTAKIPDDGGGHFFKLAHPESGSWATFRPGPTEHAVRQQGIRRLWDDLEAAYQWWIRTGRPEPRRFGLTVAPTEQRIWLDAPDNVL